MSNTEQIQNARLTALESKVTALETKVTALQASVAALITQQQAQAAQMTAMAADVAMVKGWMMAGGVHASGGVSPSSGQPLAVGTVGTVSAVTTTGGTSLAVTYPAPVTSGGTPPYTVQTVPASGSTFVVGSTPVVVTSTDSSTPPASTTGGITVTVINPTGAGSGTTTAVHDGGDLQAAINAASAGDTLVLDKAATFPDALTIPVHSGTSYITITTSGTLPSATTRILPSDAAQLPILRSATSDPVITFAAGAHHWRLLGLSIQDSLGLSDMVVIGTGLETSLADLPHDIIVDRCLIQGKTAGGTKRGLSLNASAATIVNCEISGIRRSGQDNQAIGIFQTPGPVLIENCKLEAASNAVLVGGSDPRITNQVPTNITIRGCYCYKPLDWAGFNVKNQIELKNAKTILIENTVCENSYADAQIGYGLLFTVRNQDGTAAWSTIQDVTVRYVLLKNCFGPAIGLLGLDDRGGGFPSVQGTNLIVHDVLVTGGSSIFVTSQSGFEPTTITHCTAGSVVTKALNLLPLVMPSGNLIWQNNVVNGGVYGVTGDDPTVGTIIGTPALTEFAPGYVFDHNVISPDTYALPAGNTLLTGDQILARLDPQDRYVGSEPTTDGRPMGCDIDGLRARIPWAVWP